MSDHTSRLQKRNVRNLVCNMVLILDGNSVSPPGVISVIWPVQDILFISNSSTFFFSGKAFYRHTCATCSELPSNIRTMECNVFKIVNSSKMLSLLSLALRVLHLKTRFKTNEMSANLTLNKTIKLSKEQKDQYRRIPWIITFIFVTIIVFVLLFRVVFDIKNIRMNFTVQINFDH